MKYIIFHIEGGVGKNIMATAVINAAKEKYHDRKIIVVTAWEDVWKNNPNVYRTFVLGHQNYFYEDYVKDKDSILFMHDPYHTTDHTYLEKHLIEIWCDLINVPYNKQQPELFISPREISYVKNKHLTGIQKPLFVIQPNGGLGQMPYAWPRDIPFEQAQEIVNNYVKDYAVLQVKYENQPLLKGASPVTLPLRELFALLLFSEKRLFIDSLCQHACAALGLPSTVTWVANSPKVFGYDIHDNISIDVQEAFNTKKYSYLSPYSISGNIGEYPYDTKNLFNLSEIYDSIATEKEVNIKYDI